MSRLVIVIALAACLPFSLAFAALKHEPPKGVDLNGRWKLSPELSEDAHAAVSVAREEMKEKEKGERRKKKKRGVEKPAEEPAESRSEDGRDPLESAVFIPEEFAIQQEPEAFVLMTREATDTCKTRQPSPVSVSGYGLAVRHCGWERVSFIVEVAPKQGPLSTTRYEIDKESGRLFVTSELKGERIPKISVKRVYERVEPSD